MSPEQIAANRGNAKKSTGPRTAAGKAASRLNALKHGLLAESVVVRGHKIRESVPQFQRLCHELYASLAPDGPLEEILVDEIAAVSWRLRRLRRAETGEVALSVDQGWWRRENHSPVESQMLIPPGLLMEPLAERLQRSVDGCRYLLGCLRCVRRSVERDGELTAATVKEFEAALREDAGHLGSGLRWHLDRRSANPDGLAPEPFQARHREEVFRRLDCEQEDLELLEAQHAKREDAEERAQQAAALLPAAAKLDKILRYETALERQWYRAMNQLERLQQRRLGEAIPAPLAMEVSPRN